MESENSLQVSDLFEIFFIKSYLPEVSQIIGPDNTVKLISAFGGTELNLPSKKQFLKVCRNICIYLAYNNGISPTKIKDQYGLTPQRIHQIHKETKLIIDAYYSLKARGLTRVRLSEVDNNLEIVHEALTGGTELGVSLPFGDLDDED